MNTYMPNPTKVERKWYVVDAEGQTLGRLCAEVAPDVQEAVCICRSGSQACGSEAGSVDVLRRR